MTRNIEVEVKVHLNEGAHDVLHDFLVHHAKFTGEKERVFIDYAIPNETIKDRKIDIRTRITNGVVELIIKTGTFGNGSRTETSIFVADNNLRDALSFMALLGYKKGVIGIRKIKTYQYEDMVIAVQEVIDCKRFHLREKVWDVFAEFEITTSDGNKFDTLEKLNAFTTSLGLEVFSASAWVAYIERMDQEANGSFDFEKDLETICSQIKTNPN